MNLEERYDRFEDLTLDNLYAYGHKYTAQDYMDLQRTVIRAHEAVVNGELEAGLRILETEYKRIESVVLQDEYDEEYPQVDHACFYGCNHPDHGGAEHQ